MKRNQCRLSIFIEDSFDSAHSLPHLPESHKCHFLHGHTYKVRLEFAGPVTGDGWIVDYGVVKSYWGMVKQHLDHKFLNEIVPLSTCENIAAHVFGEVSRIIARLGPPLVKLTRVELRETERCGAVIEIK